MDKQLLFALKVWGFATIIGSMFTGIVLSCVMLEPGVMIIGLYLLVFAISRGVPSLILFFVFAKLTSKTTWKIQWQLRSMALFGAICCAANIIGFIYRKKMDEIILQDMILIAVYSLTVILGVYLFRKTLQNTAALSEQEEDAPLPIP